MFMVRHIYMSIVPFSIGFRCLLNAHSFLLFTLWWVIRARSLVFSSPSHNCILIPFDGPVFNSRVSVHLFLSFFFRLLYSRYYTLIRVFGDGWPPRGRWEPLRVFPARLLFHLFTPSFTISGVFSTILYSLVRSWGAERETSPMVLMFMAAPQRHFSW